jgi:hypothetical protein
LEFYFFYYENYFEVDKEKLFFYKDKDDISYILNLKTFKINKFYLNYESFFNYINGNIIGFNSNVIGILNLKGEILLSKEIEEEKYNYGLLLSNNNLLFAYSSTLFLLDKKLNEIKRKKLKSSLYSISGIANFDKKIFVRGEDFYILNLNLEIEAIIDYYNYFNTIYKFYINNYISLYDNDFIFIDKKYMIFKYDIPYLFHPNNNKIIFGRLRNEKNLHKDFKLFYKKRKFLFYILITF